MREGTHRYRKAVERQNRGYCAPFSSARTVDDGGWVSQFDAAVGVSMMRIGFLIQSGRLEAVHNASGQGEYLGRPLNVKRRAVPTLSL